MYTATACSTCVNARSDSSHCRLTSPFQRTPANIRINLILPETGVLSYKCLTHLTMYNFVVPAQ